MSSDLVCCWWGSDLRVLGADGPCTRGRAGEGEDGAEIAAEMAASAAPAGGVVRIVHQPDGLEIHEIDAPPAGPRNRLRRVLAASHPALEERGTLWAVESPAGDGRPPALLLIDRSSRLGRLAAALARRGFRIAGAWSLVTVMEEAVRGGASGRLSLAATGDKALMSCFSPAGDAWVRSHDGPEFPEAALASYRGALACFEERARPDCFAAVEEGPHADDLRRAAAQGGPVGSDLNELLAHCRRLVPGTPADFLAGTGSKRGRRPALWIGIAALAAALCAAGWLHALHLRQEKEQAGAAEAERRLQDTLRARAGRRLSDEQAAALRARCPPQYAFDLLRELARLPAQSVLRRLAIEGRNFEAAGWENAGAPAGPAHEAWIRFRQDFGGREQPWTVEEGAAGEPDEFILRGRFNDSPASVAAQPKEQSRTGPAAPPYLSLERLVAAFPRVGEFDPPWRKSSAAVTEGDSERLSGFEIRRYTVAWARASVATWPDLYEMVRALCLQPGVEIERLELGVAAGDAERFSVAAIGAAVRLRP